MNTNFLNRRNYNNNNNNNNNKTNIIKSLLSICLNNVNYILVAFFFLPPGYSYFDFLHGCFTIKKIWQKS